MPRPDEAAASINTLLREGMELLQGSSPSPRLDTELLLAAVTGQNRAYLIGFSERPVNAEAAERFRALVRRRKKHEPIAYLTGKKEFFGLELEVSPAVLVPRPETELMVERAIEYLDNARGVVRVLDLGTGSGCIPLALASYGLKANRHVEIIAIDKSAEALAVAKRNAERHGVQEMVKFIESDWFSALQANGAFNLILSNPPYIPDGSDEVSPELAFEPQDALYAGADGLRDIITIFKSLPLFLAQHGLFLCEIGARHGTAVINQWDNLHPGLPCKREILRDLAGLERIFSVERS